MIPPTSQNILVNNLAAGMFYDLCVLAIYDDALTALTATRVVGCVHFATEPQYLRCHFMQSQFLGGTIVVIIGGIIVASVLSFIIFLIVRYRVCNQDVEDKRMELGEIHTQTRNEQLHVCGIIKSMSKQVLGVEMDACRKVSPQMETGVPTSAPTPGPRSCKPALPDCTVTTSAASHSWHPASPNTRRTAHAASHKPASTAHQPDQISIDLDNTNKNNSAKVRPKSAQIRSYNTMVTPVSRRAQIDSSHYMTVPVGCIRGNRRHSLNVDSSKQPNSGSVQQQIGSLRSKRSLSMSGGDLPQLENLAKIHGKGSLSRSEWVLESTL